MATHYYPYLNDAEDLDQFPCGSLVGESSNISASWNAVDCGRCLRSKKRLTIAVANDEKEIVKQMGEMADLMSRESI